MKFNLKKNTLELFKFGVVGILNTIIDYVVFWLLLRYTNIRIELSQTIALAAGMVNSFLLNKRWTFKIKDAGKPKDVLAFLVVNAVSILSGVLLLKMFYDGLGLHKVANETLKLFKIKVLDNPDNAILFCKIPTTLFGMMINFLGNKHFVFKGK